MDYVFACLAGFFVGVLLRACAQSRGRRHDEDGARDEGARQAEVFLRGIKAFERGVTLQFQRDRRAARLRRLTNSRNRIA